MGEGVNPWLLLGISAAVLYGLWLLLSFTFHWLDARHALEREERYRAADSRTNGREQAEGKVI